ncbi:MAG TPA: hypothetical protein VFL15_06095 [Gammaproteobacteria bacterium]|nr:hypothetical protein [Gammaproteobacteria bacterium]
MKKPIILLILLGLATLSIGLSGCGTKGNGDSDDAALTMRAYSVPAGQTDAIARTLTQLLSTGKGNTTYLGYASVPSPGQVVVLAPANMQASIAESVKAIVSHTGAISKPEPLQLKAWVVDAYPGKGPDDPQLKSIQPALDAFATDMGPSRFVGIHYLTAVSDPGIHAGLSPDPGTSLQYRVEQNQGNVVLYFNYMEPGLTIYSKNISTQADVDLHGTVTTKLGQTLVLGLVSERPDGKGPGSIHRLLVVRITPANQG